jgi:hypothetical protein
MGREVLDALMDPLLGSHACARAQNVYMRHAPGCEVQFGVVSWNLNVRDIQLFAAVWIDHFTDWQPQILVLGCVVRTCLVGHSLCDGIYDLLVEIQMGRPANNRPRILQQTGVQGMSHPCSLISNNHC